MPHESKDGRVPLPPRAEGCRTAPDRRASAAGFDSSALAARFAAAIRGRFRTSGSSMRSDARRSPGGSEDTPHRTRILRPVPTGQIRSRAGNCSPQLPARSLSRADRHRRRRTPRSPRRGSRSPNSRLASEPGARLRVPRTVGSPYRGESRRGRADGRRGSTPPRPERFIGWRTSPRRTKRINRLRMLGPRPELMASRASQGFRRVEASRSVRIVGLVRLRGWDGRRPSRCVPPSSAGSVFARTCSLGSADAGSRVPLQMA